MRIAAGHQRVIEKRQLVPQLGGFCHELRLRPGRTLRMAFEASDDFVLQAPMVASRNVLQPLVDCRGMLLIVMDGTGLVPIRNGIASIATESRTVSVDA